MSKVPFHYIDLRTFCYATEDEKRVIEAIRAFLPEEFELERMETKGHHGDRIVIFSARVEKADDVRVVLDKLAELENIDKVRAEIDQRVDDNCSFFIHLDKQAAFKGIAQLGEGLSLRGKVEAYPAKKAKAVEIVRDAI
ncbi:MULTISPECIES: RNA-binding protein [unclassified Haladaptatus]|uniref:RNA-binding protein n=1 Tax=unclassified Haladaptatus TaxID=2622732 RepID=UPI002FCE0743